MKFVHNVPENQILEMLSGMGCHVSQSTLNDWMHTAMRWMKDHLEPPMIRAVRHSRIRIMTEPG